jgi:lipase
VAALFVSSFGSGRPILCLHGIEAHGIRFVGLAERLRATLVLAPDLRGHGRSPMEGPWTIEQHMRDLVPILENLGPDAVLLGHSYGGLIAWELARIEPELISALILVDPAIAITSELAGANVAQFSAVEHR